MPFFMRKSSTEDASAPGISSQTTITHSSQPAGSDGAVGRQSPDRVPTTNTTISGPRSPSSTRSRLSSQSRSSRVSTHGEVPATEPTEPPPAARAVKPTEYYAAAPSFVSTATTAVPPTAGAGAGSGSAPWSSCLGAARSPEAIMRAAAAGRDRPPSPTVDVSQIYSAKELDKMRRKGINPVLRYKMEKGAYGTVFIYDESGRPIGRERRNFVKRFHMGLTGMFFLSTSAFPV